MSIYLKPILTACYLFPLLALLFTLPYIIHQYNKYGSILILRTGIVYSFIFYMMTSYFMTILPLPSIDSVTPESAAILLIPFDAVRRAAYSCNFSVTNPSTYAAFLTSSDFLQIIFNILLLLPFGVYLRYYFNRKWYQTLILSFIYSLFFEITQLSGLYGIYPYPYRFFEVDDLICNTLGGMLGFLVTPALLFFLPSRQKLDSTAYKRGMEVSCFRRIFAMLADYGAVLIIYFLLKRFTPVNEILSYEILPHEILPYKISYFTIPAIAFCYYTLSALIFSGRSIGKFLVNIQLVNRQDKRAGFIPLFIRMFILHGILIPAPYYIITGMGFLSQPLNRNIEIFIIITISVLIAVLIFFGVNFVFCFAGKNKALFYDYITHLKVISTIHKKSQSSL